MEDVSKKPQAASVVGGVRGRGKRSTGPGSGNVRGSPPASGAFVAEREGYGPQISPGIMLFLGLGFLMLIMGMHLVTKFQQAVAK